VESAPSSATKSGTTRNRTWKREFLMVVAGGSGSLATRVPQRGRWPNVRLTNA
jgi:hypothetical protein